MTKRGAGGSVAGRLTSPRSRQPPAKPPPRARCPPESWGPLSRGGAARGARRSAVFARGAARGGTKAIGTPQVAWGKGRLRAPAAEGPAPPLPSTRSPPHPCPRRDVGGHVPVGPGCSPEAGNQLSPPLHPGAGPSPGALLPPSLGRGTFTILPAPLRPARSGPHPAWTAFPGPLTAALCSSQEAPRTPEATSPVPSCTPSLAHLTQGKS